jgi:hypothetical protein
MTSGLRCTTGPPDWDCVETGITNSAPRIATAPIIETRPTTFPGARF